MWCRRLRSAVNRPIKFVQETPILPSLSESRSWKDLGHFGDEAECDALPPVRVRQGRPVSLLGRRIDFGPRPEEPRAERPKIRRAIPLVEKMLHR